jgi:hypothetical protein
MVWFSESMINMVRGAAVIRDRYGLVWLKHAQHDKINSCYQGHIWFGLVKA